MKKTVLVDTSAWIEFLRPNGDEGIASQVSKIMESNKASWNSLIELELNNGVFTREEKKLLGNLAEVVDKLEIDDQVWQIALELSTKMQIIGKTAPASDLVIYATSLRHQTGLVHRDKHFEWLESL